MSWAQVIGRELRDVGASVRVQFRLLDRPTRKRSLSERFKHPNRFRRGRVERMPDNTWALIGPPNKVWPLAGTRVIDANYRGFWDVDEVWDAHRFLCKGPAFPNGIEFRVWDMGHKDEKLRFILRVVEPD